MKALTLKLRPARAPGSIISRLLGGYALCMGLLALTWAVGAYSAGQMTSRSTHIVQVNGALLANVMEQVKLMDDEETGLRGYLLTRSSDFLEPYTRAQRSLPVLRMRGSALAGGVQGAQPLLRDMTRREFAWENWAGELLRHPSPNPTTRPAVAAQVEGKNLFDCFRLASSTLSNAISVDRRNSLDTSRRIASLLNRISASIFLLTILVTLVVGGSTLRAIVQPLGRLRRSADTIASGNLDEAVDVKGTREFTELARSMDHMRRQLAHEAAVRSNVERVLQTHAERLAATVETQTAVAAAGPHLDEVLAIATQRAMDLTGASGSAVELLEGDEMVYHAAAGTAVSSLGLRLRQESSLSGMCVRTGEILRCDDSETDPRVNRDACRRVGAGSMIVVPLNSGTGTEGVLKVMAAQPAAFDENDIDTLQLMAGEIAAAMRSASEFEAKQALLAERTRVLDELELANRNLKHQALHDALTGLPNRVLLQDRLEQTVLSSRRNAMSAALFLLDLDGFKAVNDTRGHHVGDALLQEVAARLRGSLRASDTVARLGGDEFAVILPAVDRERAEKVAAMLGATLRRSVDLVSGQIEIGASIGIALFPFHGDDPATLLRHADTAMYTAKRAGGGYCTYNEEREAMGSVRLALVTDRRVASHERAG